MIDREYSFRRDRSTYFSRNQGRRLLVGETIKSTASHGKGCGCGCLVPIMALVGAVLSVAAGLSCSVRVPLTESNVSVGGSVGDSKLTEGVLADYLQPRVADDDHFANGTNKWHLWKLGAMSVSVTGEQPEAPLIDLHLDIDKQ